MEVNYALSWASEWLSSAGIENPYLESTVLLSYLLKKGRSYLYSHPSLQLSSFELEEFSNMIEKRAKHYPLAYIVGEKEFMSLPFMVNENVIVPRIETEILVEETLKLINSGQRTAESAQKGRIKNSPLIPTCWTGRTHHSKLLDIGTGCGNIALSLAKYNRNLHVYAVDVSSSALDVAGENRRRLSLEDSVSLIICNLWDYFKHRRWKGQIDFIVTNPPYVCTNDLHRLAPEVLYEPEEALDGGKDGLTFYPPLIEAGEFLLKKGGYLLMEVGEGQAEKVRKKVEETESFEEVYLRRDYSGTERVVIARRKK